MKRVAVPKDHYTSYSQSGLGERCSSSLVLLMLTMTFCRSFVTLGAIITILALGIEASFQQMAKSSVHCFPRHILPPPVLGMVRQYTNPWPIELDQLSPQPREGDYILERSLKAGVYEGLFGNPSAMNATCLTGDCSWNWSKSLGVCNQCQDVSGSIRVDGASLISNRFARRFLDNGLELANSTSLINSSTSIQLSEIEYIPWTLLNMSIMSAHAAYECSMFWCVQERNATMSAGVLKEHERQIWSKENLTYDQQASTYSLTNECRYEAKLGSGLGTDLTLHTNDCRGTGGIGCCYINLYTNRSRDGKDTFSVDYMTHFTLKTFLQDCLHGSSLYQQTPA